jgi:hypothetical protein
MRAIALAVHEVDDPPQRLLLRVVPQAGAARRDAPVGRRAGHLDHHQRGAAERASAEVHEVEILHDAVDCAVGGHRRDDDAVLQRVPRTCSGSSIGGSPAACVAATPAVAGHPGLEALQPARGRAGAGSRG